MEHTINLETAIAGLKNGAYESNHLAFLIFGADPDGVRVSTENSKDSVILARCAAFGPATA